MKVTLLSILLAGCILPSAAQFKNVKVADKRDGDTHPLNIGIAIQAKEPSVAVITVSPDRTFHTADGGQSWTEVSLASELGLGEETAIISDLKGHLHILHSSDKPGEGDADTNGLNRIVTQKSTDGGKTWSSGVAIGNNPAKDQRSAWPAVHPKRPILYAAWSEFDSYLLTNVNCHSNILFSMSTNAGGKWQKPVQINQSPGNCNGSDNSAEGATVAVGSDGRIFVTWANQGYIFFDRSYDGGEMWLMNDIALAKQQAGWSMKVPGHKPVSGKPVIGIDNTQSRTNGSLFVVYADQVESENDTDIWMLRSTNRGDSWTRPVSINSDETRSHQYLPAMAVDEVTGNIFIVYYDRRNSKDLQTDVYIAYSFDAGNTFHESKVSESSFEPNESALLSQNLAIAVFDGLVMPVWTRLDQGKVSVWTTAIKQEQLRKK